MDKVYKNSIYYNPSAFKKLKMISAVLDAGVVVNESSNLDEALLRASNLDSVEGKVKKTGKSGVFSKSWYKTMKYSYSNVNGKKRAELVIDDSENPDGVVKYVFTDKNKNEKMNSNKKTKTLKKKKVLKNKK